MPEEASTPRYQIFDRVTGETVETNDLAIYCIQNVLVNSSVGEPSPPPSNPPEPESI